MLYTLLIHSSGDFPAAFHKSFAFALLLVSAGLHKITGVALRMVFVELNAVISMLQFPYAQIKGSDAFQLCESL